MTNVAKKLTGKLWANQMQMEQAAHDLEGMLRDAQSYRLPKKAHEALARAEMLLEYLRSGLNFSRETLNGDECRDVIARCEP